MKRKVIAAPADRVDSLSSPFLAELEGLTRSMVRRGRSVIDLGRFALQLEPPAEPPAGPEPVITQIKNSFAEYLESKYHTRINPDRELLLMPGGRSTLLLLGIYLVEPGRACYVPDPGFTSYRSMARLFGGEVKKYALYERNDFVPNVSAFESRSSKKMKLLLLNSPHNPTGAICDKSFYAKLQQLAARENLLAIVDSSYSLNSGGNLRVPLFCEVRKRLKIGIELFSLSTNLCAPELKLTLLVGRRELLAPLSSLVHSFGLLPCAAVVNAARPYFASAETLGAHLDRCRQEIQSRVRMMAERLTEAGIDFYPVLTMPYLWVKLKRGRVSLSFARGLLRRKGIAVAPGSAFGEEGEGWVRVAANVAGERLESALIEFIKYYQPIKSRLRERRKD